MEAGNLFDECLSLSERDENSSLEKGSLHLTRCSLKSVATNGHHERTPWKVKGKR